MPLASFNNGEQESPSQSYQHASEQPISRTLATVFGYMAIGVGISLGVAIGVALLFFNIWGQRTLDEALYALGGGTDAGVIAYVVILIASFITLLIMSFVMARALNSSTRSAWPAFIIYASVMGILMSTFVMVVDIWTLGQALGTTAVVFAAMFLIGRFSKVNLNPLGLIASGIMLALILVGGFWLIFYWANPTGFQTFDMVFSFIVVGLMMIITAVDAYNIKNILVRGQANRNVLLYCAFVLYSDFITLLIRILYLILRLQGRNK